MLRPDKIMCGGRARWLHTHRGRQTTFIDAYDCVDTRAGFGAGTFRAPSVLLLSEPWRRVKKKNPSPRCINTWRARIKMLLSLLRVEVFPSMLI